MDSTTEAALYLSRVGVSDTVSSLIYWKRILLISNIKGERLSYRYPRYDIYKFLFIIILLFLDWFGVCCVLILLHIGRSLSFFISKFSGLIFCLCLNSCCYKIIGLQSITCDYTQQQALIIKYAVINCSTITVQCAKAQYKKQAVHNYTFVVQEARAKEY